MIFMLDLMALVLILRASVKVGYYPVFWGLIYGTLNTVLHLVPGGALSAALIIGAVSGVACGILLFVLSLVDDRPVLWWVVVISSFAIPFFAGAVN